MNAPATAASMIPSTLEQIPITAIRPSMTKIQVLRRSHFNPGKLLELADSIKTQGLLQPILVRPVAPDGITKYELIAGERRWLAADRAGLAHIDCNVRELTDGQVLEAQLVENLQREDVHPLEEAEGYRELINLKNLRPEELGALIGKSRAYVYARVKLLDLCPAGRALLDSGDLDASKALVIARFVPKLQEKILKDYRTGTDERTSFREFIARTRNHFMVDLTEAPFSRDDDKFFTLEKQEGTRLKQRSPLLACIDCPSYSRNDGELQAAFDADAHVCTDKSCFDVKVVQFYDRARKAAEDAGKPVLTGAAAKAALPDDYDGVNAEYLRLDVRCDDVAFPEPEPKDSESPEWQAWAERQDVWRPPTFRELLDGALADRVTLAEEGKGKLNELVPAKEAAKLLKAKGIKIDVPKRESAQREIEETSTEDLREQQAKEQERRDREEGFRRRVFQAIAAKWKGPLKQPELVMLAEHWVENCVGDEINAVYPGNIQPGQMKEADVCKLLALLLVEDCVSPYRQPQPLMAMAKRLKIDPAKIKKQIAEEEKAAKKAAKTEAKK